MAQRHTALTFEDQLELEYQIKLERAFEISTISGHETELKSLWKELCILRMVLCEDEGRAI